MKPWRPVTAGDNSCWSACNGEADNVEVIIFRDGRHDITN
ncbi:hypothetical protein Syncc8109_1912 [Synechococcus sp. WH 8109]|nr:hypothetical protein Syncc8109_1912 [Synechococcus sp. WH 8109]